MEQNVEAPQLRGGALEVSADAVRPEGSNYSTESGSMYCGKAETVLSSEALLPHKGRTQLIFTSPPFPLNRKKRYGNLRGAEYADWLAGMAPLLVEFLASDGSIVLELGNAWERGKPVMSTLPLEALLAFKRRGDLELCQEFICFNPARLPTPAQWVTVERIRVKDAFTRVWWMSPTARPKADNRSILTTYSRSMKRLLERGTYNAGLRPSGHRIGDSSFLRNHGGAIPPNVLIPPLEDLVGDPLELLPIANTSSKDPYQVLCREAGVDPHPARMPSQLVEFFVNFLTEPGDLVLDPFAGSNSTGHVAEQLGRNWISIEADPRYVEASRLRFRTSSEVAQPP